MVLHAIPLNHPFTCVVTGPTGSGKSVLVRRILEDHKRQIEGGPTGKLKVLWAYGIHQPLYNQEIRNCDVTYVEGLGENDVLSIKPDVIVVDDLMSEKASDKEMANLFTRGSHHLGISVFFIVQNAFEKGMRTISLNATYFIIMKNPRDKSQVTTLGVQLFGKGKSGYFLEAYENATELPYGYLLVDNSQICPPQYRLRTDLFDQHQTAFEPR